MNLKITDYGHVYENESAKIVFSNKNSYQNLNELPLPLIFTKQVHKTKILEISNKQNHTSLSLLDEADGLTCRIKNIALGIQTADCVPCFLFNSKEIFSLHLGWRGLVYGLLDSALTTVSKEEPLTLLIGPHIGLNSFEVGVEVLDIFSANHDYKEWSKTLNQQYFVSLSKIIEQKCTPYNVEVLNTNIDTFTSDNHFSYRRAIKGNIKTPFRNISYGFLKD